MHPCIRSQWRSFCRKTRLFTRIRSAIGRSEFADARRLDGVTLAYEYYSYVIDTVSLPVTDTTLTPIARQTKDSEPMASANASRRTPSTRTMDTVANRELRTGYDTLFEARLSLTPLPFIQPLVGPLREVELLMSQAPRRHEAPIDANLASPGTESNIETNMSRGRSFVCM